MEEGESKLTDQELKDWLLAPLTELDKWIMRKTGE